MQFTVPRTCLTIYQRYVKVMRIFLGNYINVVVTICFLLKFNSVNAQTVGQGRAPQIFAPNTYSFGLYGDVPVDYSSGLPQISIPLMTFSDREINLDISLSYHASGIKVDQEATWVGLGWVLNSGGVITREIRGLPDGYKNGNFLTRTTFPYYNGNIQQNEFSNAGTLLNIAASENGTDNGADIFYYNFNGRAGKFFLDENAKATFVKYEDIDVKFLNDGGYLNEDYFVITDEKGIRYEFAALERTTNVTGSFLTYISAWYLSKITSPEGGEINFQYVNGGLTTQNFQKRCYDQVYFPIQPTAHQSFPSEYYQTCISRETNISGIVIKKITNSAGQYIEFVTSPNPRLDAETPNANNLLDAAVLYNAQNVALKKFKFTYSYFEANNSHKISSGPQSFLNYRLRLDALQEVSSSGQLQNPYTFTYFGDNDPVTDDPYTLPYRLSPCQDHWGYYNSTYNTIIFPSNPIDKPFHKDEWNLALLGLGGMDYFGNGNMGFFLNGANREPDGEATKAGALQKITYPTGGSTSFGFAQHETDPNTSKPLSGGLKITQIQTNDGGGHTQTKNYEYYGNDGSGSQCVLVDNLYYNWYHQPYYPGGGGYAYINELIGLGVPPNLASNYTDIGRADGTSQLGLGLSASSPYMIVTEHTPGNGYTVYDYTFVEDNNLIYDGLSVPGAYEGTYIKTTNTSTYPPFTHSLNDMSSCVFPFPNFLNNDWRRGHLLSRKVYSENNQLLFEENNTYDIHALKAVEGHKIAKISEWEFFYSRYYQLGGIVKRTKQVSKTYDNNGNFIETIKDFEYGSQVHKQLTESRESTSKGDIIKTTYKYPHDFTAGISTPNVYDEMVARHIWSPVIKTDIYKGTGFLQSQKINYDYWNNGNWTTSSVNSLILPRTVESARLSSNPEIRTRYHAYDDRGNVLSMSKENDVKESYLWGYNNLYPVARVVGADHNSISALVDQNILNNTGGVYSDVQIRTELNKIRTGLASTKSLVTTYTYKPLIGMTSQTDPNGRITYYEYDDFGRLSLVRDHDGNILKKICYNYAGQPQDCGAFIFSSVAKSGTFTRNNCGTNGTGSVVIYNVAAGVYTSTISQADADQKAQNDVNTNGQTYANANGTCTWTNQVQSGNFTRNNCGTNGTGSTVTYTILAGTHSSTVSLADANQQAINAVNAGGQSYANANGTCTWTNQTQSGNFTRNNCGTNGTGSTVIFNVGAGTYSSTVSLADANQQAINAVNAGGQSYANANGTCTWTNQAQSGNFTRNNCGTNGTGSTVIFNVAAGTYSSTVSLAAANQQAINAVSAGGQAYANANAGCTWVNQAQTVNFTRNNCGTNGTGATIGYTVAAGTYSSTVSLADANQQAINYANANGQVYANANAGCTWYNQAQSNNFTRNNCSNGGIGGTVPYSIAANSFTSTTSLADANQQALNAVNAGGQTYANANASCTWMNQEQTRYFTRNNCSGGLVGSLVSYTIPANTHSSTVSQADANQLAYNAATAAGQAYANANGSCYCQCTVEGQSCVNNVCEAGIKVYTSSVFDESTNMWTCYYHYEFSNGSWTGDYSEISGMACYQP